MNSKKRSACLLCTTFAVLLLGSNATAQSPVLGNAASYAVLGGSTVTNTGPSVINGDLGVSPGTAVTGFPPGVVNGTIRTDGAAAPGQTDLTTAYNDAAGRGPATTVASELGGQTLVAGVYTSESGTFTITGTLTLDGQNNPNAVFIFQVGSTLITASGSQVVLINRAQPCGLFWQVGSSATLGTNTSFQGNLLALSSITVTTGASINGRALARNGAVTLDTNSVTVPVCTGSIQVIKNSVGGDATFGFTSTFGLTTLTTASGTVSQTFDSLTPGSYSLTETALANWTQTAASCTNGTPAAINVGAVATTICTITNTFVPPPPPGSIMVVKNTIGGDGTFGFTSNFGLTFLTTASGTASQTFSGLAAGASFSVSESVPSGWTQTSATCTHGTPAAAIVTSGATTVCTFTNLFAPPPLPGSIRVVKTTVGGDGSFTFTSNFGLTSITTLGGTGSQIFSGLTPGASFTLSENVPAGWVQNSAGCTNGAPGAINVVSGATTTCTIVNSATLVAPSAAIQVVKNTIGGNGTFTFVSNFGLTALTTTGNAAGGSASQMFSNLIPGASYSLLEIVPPGWTQTAATCNNGTPAAIVVISGTTTTCTITNSTAAPASNGAITIVKNSVGGNGAFTFASNFGMSTLTTVGGTASQTFTGMTPGSGFSIRENASAGWTQTGASCTNGTPTAITVVAGATTTCTFTNAQAAATTGADITIAKNHVGDFRQGDTADPFSLIVTNMGASPTTGAVSVTDTLPAGLTATAIGGTGWNCNLASLTCTRSDALAAGASFPVITVTVSVSTNPLIFTPTAVTPAFETGDLLISMADGSVQWRRSDFTLVRVLTSATNGQAKGMAFDAAGNFYVTHWIGAGSTGNNIVRFDRNGNLTGVFGSGFNCNPSSLAIDNAGNVYVGQADCGGQVLKFDPAGNLLATYTVAVENRGSGHIALDPNQCTLYYTSEGPNVKAFNVCTNTQMANFNTAPLPDPTDGGQGISLLPAGGMLVANLSVIARLNAAGVLVKTYQTTEASQCWLATALDPDGTSFWASNWCASSITRFDLATGQVLETHVADPNGFMIKQIFVPGNIFSFVVTNTAAVVGGGDSNTGNNSASDATTIRPPAQPAPVPNSIVNAISFATTVAPGSIGSVFGSNLALGRDSASAMPLPTTLGGSSIQIGGRGAPLFFASPTQVNLQIPWELAGQTQAPVMATVGAMAASLRTVSIAPFAPGIFTVNGSGAGQGVVLIANTALLAAPSAAGQRPALRGESVSIYSTGLGAVSNQPATGLAALADPLSVTTSAPVVTIGGATALVSFSGLTPGAVGVYQVNVEVPAGAPVGDAVPVTLSIGGVTSNTVTIAIESR